MIPVCRRILCTDLGAQRKLDRASWESAGKKRGAKTIETDMG